MAKGWHKEPVRHREAAIKGRGGHQAPLEKHDHDSITTVAKVVKPNRNGTDLIGGKHRGRELDGHMRIEDGEIAIDLFDSSVPTKGSKDPWVGGDRFPHTLKGAEEATEFIQSYGFNIGIKLKRR